MKSFKKIETGLTVRADGPWRAIRENRLGIVLALAAAYLFGDTLSIYRYCGRVLVDFDPARSVAIGDSMCHDVVGGARAGLATVLVTSGIRQADFAGAADEPNHLWRMSATARQQGVWPDRVIPRFAW